MVMTHSLARNETTNAGLAWGLVAVLLLAAALHVAAGGFLWGGFALVAAGIIALPAALTREWRLMVPWLLGVVVAAPVVLQLLELYPEISGYVAVSGVALVVVVELNAFSDVEMSRRFAVLFAVLTTMALQSWWTVSQYYSDQWLGTTFIQSQTELQWDLVAATVVSLVMGGLFLWYFDHIEHVGSRKDSIVSDEAS